MNRPVFGAGHRFNGAKRVTGVSWPCEDPMELVSNLTYDDAGNTVPAMPSRRYHPKLRQRVAAAWLVLTGRAAAVRWQEHPH